MNNNFRISIGEFEVLASGVVLTHMNKGIQFYIDELVFDVSFKTNEDSDKPSINATVSSDNPRHLNIVLINYDDNFGKGLVYPVEVGTLNDKTIYFQFMTSTVGKTETRVFEYTWLAK